MFCATTTTVRCSSPHGEAEAAPGFLTALLCLK
jgi:hypothetical protein